MRVLDSRETTPGGGRAARSSEPTARSAVTTLTCLAAASGAYLLALQSQLTFRADDWEFLLRRSGWSVGVFLRPHNDHIAIVPVAVYKVLLEMFGMTSALPFQIVSTLVFLLSVGLLFVYLRLRVGNWAALLGSALILFLGAAYTDLLWSFQIGFFGSMAAGIGALLAVDRDDRKGDVVACMLLVVAISFSELGVPFAAGAFVSLVLGPSRRYARTYVSLVPLALYGLWYLGWGHEGPHTFSFHNFINSPGFIFDFASENLAALLGLATPLSGKVGENAVGLNWGRILLVLAIGLAIWRVSRTPRPSRRLIAVLAAAGTFWFLTALNAIPLLRTPTSSRYQYAGAIFVLLIAAELLRGVRLGRWLLTAATVIATAAAVSGILLLHDGYNLFKGQSDILRARLAAWDIGRGGEARGLRIGFPPFYVVPASRYYSAVDAFGSPALSEAQLAVSKYRALGDQILARIEGIKPLQPATSTSQGKTSGTATCSALTVDSSGRTALPIPPGRYTLHAIHAPGASIRAARYAHLPRVSLGVLSAHATASIDIPRDHSPRPWRLYSLGPSAVSVCVTTDA